MGITGLLPLLKSIQTPTHLRKFAGQVIGVDAYGWLHRGTVACAIELAQQKPTRKHIDFALNRVRMLIHFGVKPYMVFDGDYLPSKAHTEAERAARRKESRRVGLQLLGMGRVSQAHLELQKAVDVTPNMARELIEELKRLNVPYVVAPYEADAQLAYLEKHGLISGVLSEDSDLLVFGVKCLLTKLDQYGECVMLNRSNFTACREVSLVGWTDQEFRTMAMLSGCDYLPGIEKMGLKTAYRLVRKHKSVEKVIRTVQFDGKMKVPANYLEDFANAERTFLYQWSYCPKAKGLVNLNTVPSNLDVANMPFIGAFVEPHIATGVANGELDPNTKQRLTFNARPQQSSLRAAMVHTPIEKQGKPISEFFKPKRTPLAELDPNSFTPSPSQQRLLENQQGASWSSSIVPSDRPEPLDRTAATDVPFSAPQPGRRAVSDNFLSAHNAMLKRQRLCSDNTIASHMDGLVGLQSATSRFFSNEQGQQSPSLRKASSQRRKDDFELWSDDSTAEVVAALAATQEVTATQTPSPRKRKKLSIYADATDAAEDSQAPTASGSGSLTQATLDPQETDQSQGNITTLTPETSFDSLGSNDGRTAFSAGLDHSFSALKERFAFPNDNAGNKTSSLQVKNPLQTKNSNEAIGTTAPITSPVKHSPMAKVEVAASSPSAAPDLTDDQEDEEWTLVQQALRTPHIQGSEDLLVPNSPEGLITGDFPQPKLDLGRFTFAG